jgi:hypothetical protein
MREGAKASRYQFPEYQAANSKAGDENFTFVNDLISITYLWLTGRMADPSEDSCAGVKTL